MAFGFSPKNIQKYNLDNLDKEHFLVLAIEAARKIGWNVSFVSETGFIAYTQFSISSVSEEVTVTIDNEAANIKSECIGAQMMDWGKNKRNINELIYVIERAKKELTQSEIETKIVELRQSYVSSEDDILSKPPAATKGKITNFFSIFKPTKGYFVTPILININILVFIAMIVSGVHFLMPENQSLLEWGANFRPLTLAGQWWRLLTSTFLHIGIWHLLLNMYALLYIGFLLEPHLGKTRFLAAYLISGIASSVTSLWWNDLIISAGASGAIFGMYGVFLALLTTNLLDKSVKKTLLASIVFFVGYNIFYGLKPDSGIDNAAHIGGLISGLMIGYAFVPSLKKNDNLALKLLTIGILSVVLLVFSFAVCKSLQNDIGKYYKKMEEFDAMQSMAVEVFYLSEDTPKEKILYELKERGIYYWNENIKLLESLNDLNLPQSIRERNAKLKEYCELRIKSYELYYKATSEETDRYEMEINDYNNKIEAIVKELTEEQ
ncbi:MAG: rhomboid family intramembrane serine protease [Lentimicrobiaceae bacterium]|nr:rhomboid family intramembrane serine protease [Lentimicrobiaceae bacterium]